MKGDGLSPLCELTQRNGRRTVCPMASSIFSSLAVILSFLLILSILLVCSVIRTVSPQFRLAHFFVRDDSTSTGLLASTAFPDYDLANPKESFVKVSELLIREVVQALPKDTDMPAEEVTWVENMLQYNVKGGKMNRGLMVVTTGAELLRARGEVPTSEQLTKLAVLGVCVEWLQAWLLMTDDIMDESETRRGRPCWHRQPHVQTGMALNDALIVEMMVYRILKSHFGTASYYLQLVDLFHEKTFQTECGQLADTRCANMELKEFTLSRWTWISKYKTSFYSFYLPVALGMYFVGFTSPKAFEVAKEALVQLGIYFQAQDDFLDCFASPEQLGKIGTDIQDKKCSWLFTQVYHTLASPEQKAFLDKHYGRCKVDSEEELAIRKMYKDVGMEGVYNKYEQTSYDSFVAMKPAVEAQGLPWAIFETFLAAIFKRSK
eukprot:gnl/TRDRNA2_/TRDRNA2_157982_c0_seq1.p1 gnl/TRDRNA2_/TRDRNA2_157982_c0~~gnl/TRDRNA2_/TRDRNA2_157982_c0_seq1.p1  ORF type:complete len:434 (-),score=76.56 gnl/TRDRNA2_/TRDRNA2_157982_c0_seq1:279-1580(-)